MLEDYKKHFKDLGDFCPNPQLISTQLSVQYDVKASLDQMSKPTCCKPICGPSEAQ